MNNYFGRKKAPLTNKIQLVAVILICVILENIAISKKIYSEPIEIGQAHYILQ